MRATLDLIGLYNYNPKLLDELVLPEAIEDKRGDLVDNLLLETAELEVLYTDPDFMQKAIGIWSKKQSPIWAELYDTTQYEYNPIWNKDGKIVEERDLAGTEDVTTNVDREDKLQDKNTRNTEDKNTRNFEDKETRNLSDTSDRDVYGFNSSTAAPADKTSVLGTGTDTFNHTGTDTFNHTGTDTIDHTGTQDIDTTVDRDTTDTGTITRTEQGNIGLTSTQQLIQEQREVVKFNILDYIINEFRDRFCLKVY